MFRTRNTHTRVIHYQIPVFLSESQLKSDRPNFLKQFYSWTNHSEILTGILNIFC